MMSRGLALMALRERTSSCTVAPRRGSSGLCPSLDGDLRLRNRGGLAALRHRGRLGNLVLRGDLDGEAGLGGGDGKDGHVGAHHYGAGALVDDDLRHAIGGDLQIIETHDQVRHVRGVIGGHGDGHRAGVADARDGIAEVEVYGLRQAIRGIEVGLVQAEAEVIVVHQRGGHRALDEGAVW